MAVNPVEEMFLKRSPPKSFDPKMGAMVYHYTGYAALASIVERRELWASNIHFLNDEAEFQHGFECLSDAVARYLSCRSIDPDAYAERLKSQVERLDEIKIHILSFSELDDTLSQWRGYTPSGGVCVGFSADHLKAVCQELARDNKEPVAFQLSPCLYDDDRKEEVCDYLVETSFFQRDPLPVGAELDECIWKFVKAFSLYACLFKHKGFAEEKEWRLVSQPISPRHSRIGFYAASSYLRPYFKFPLANTPIAKGDFDIGIRHVTISPTQRSNLIMQSIVDLFHRYRVSWLGISPSDIPYRSL